jgi:hypothetical protein
MRSSTMIRWIGATGVVAALTLGTAAGAYAATPVRLQTVKDEARVAIAGRVAALHTAIGAVGGSAYMGADRGILTGAMQSDITGLTQLEATIQADTTLETARADAGKIYTDYRIYALVLPVTHMVRATDAIQNEIVPALTTVAGGFQAVIDRKGATGQQATLDDMKAQIAAARQATNGLAPRLEAFTPAQWNADHTLLTADRAALQTARADLVKARQDARTLTKALVHA